MLHAKIEKVAIIMPKRGIFLVENRKFCSKTKIFLKNQIFYSKFIEIIGPNEFDLFFKKHPTTGQKIQKYGSVAKSPKTWQMSCFRDNVTSLQGERSPGREPRIKVA
jgi:hypothetical protein